jgi:geranylgeranyl pyrophosphate synthase
MSHQDVLERLRQSVAPELERSHQIMHEVATNTPGNLSHYLDPLVSRPGKRMRAVFIMLLVRAMKDTYSERAALVAASVELLHLATLIHDDIIDESELRRNEETAHKKWGTQVAVLIGDYALSQSLELVMDDADRRLPKNICLAASKLVAGEILEVEHAGTLDLTHEVYQEVIYGKTASLWETCGECAAVVAGLDQDEVQKWAELGRHLGMAFQIIDDLLDYGVGAEDLGKKSNSDLKNGLTTLPLILFFQEASEEQKQSMKDLLAGETVSTTEVSTLLAQVGSFQKTKEIALEHIHHCVECIQAFPESEYRDRLLELCDLMKNRSN